MRDFGNDEMLRAIVFAAIDLKFEQLTGRRPEPSFSEICQRFFDEPRLSPSLRRYTPGGFDPQETAYRHLFGETQAYFQMLTPLVRVLERR